MSHLVRKHVFFFFGLFPNWSRRIKCSFSTFSGLVSSAYSLGTPFSFMYFRTSLHLSFSVPIFRCPPIFMFSLLHLLQSFSPHGLTISVSLLIFRHLCLPHLPLLLILLSSSSQSSLFPSSISTFSSLFFLASFAQPFSVPRSHYSDIRTGLMLVVYTATLMIIGTLLSHTIPYISRAALTQCFTSSSQRPFSLVIESRGQDYKRFSSMSRCSTHNLCSEMT